MLEFIVLIRIVKVNGQSQSTSLAVEKGSSLPKIDTSSPKIDASLPKIDTSSSESDAAKQFNTSGILYPSFMYFTVI